MLAWAIDRYRHSSAWAALAPATRRQRENIYRAVTSSAGAERLADIDAQVVREGRERHAATPQSANNFLKAMRGPFAWALEYEHVSLDPTKGVTLIKGRNGEVGFNTWTKDELARYKPRHAIGARERLAFDFLLYTGLRRGDAVKPGRHHVRDGVLTLRTEKTGEEVVLPILPALARSIEATPTGDLAFLVTERGMPFVKESFGNWFGAVCRKAGCPGSASGLRKAGATRAAENGATDQQLMALYAWKNAKMVAHYTRTADKRKLALSAARLLAAAHSENTVLPHPSPGEGVIPKPHAK